MQKLSHMVDAEWVEHARPALFARDGPGGAGWLFATAPGGDPNVFMRMVEALDGPYALLRAAYAAQ